MIARFPHCDGNVLHKPGECVYCDMPEFKQLHEWREANDINYTGHTDRSVPCPAEQKRKKDIINAWSGNQAKTQEQLDKEAAEFAKMLEEWHEDLNSD